MIAAPWPHGDAVLFKRGKQLGAGSAIIDGNIVQYLRCLIDMSIVQPYPRTIGLRGTRRPAGAQVSSPRQVFCRGDKSRATHRVPPDQHPWLKGLAPGIVSCVSTQAIRQRGDSPCEVLPLARAEVRRN